MIAYKFCVSNDGTLICYKSDKTLTKYTGENAEKMMRHIKDFSFYTFETITQKIDTNKYTRSLRFVSNNHIVEYENIKKFQNKNTSININQELKDVFNIIKKNNKIKEQEKLLTQRLNEEKKRKLLITLKSAKTKLAALQTASVIGLTSLVSTNSYNTNLNNDNSNINLIESSDLVSNEFTNVIENKLDNNEILTQEQLTYANSLAIERMEEKQAEAKQAEAKQDEEIIEEIEEEIIPEEELQLMENIENYDGLTLDSYNGVVTTGPSGGKETYYDADNISSIGMRKVIEYMRELGYDEENYPYYIREDGVRMFGRYVMVAANLDIYPKGTLIETSLGVGMVCDACLASEEDIYQLDIAVNWTKKLWK